MKSRALWLILGNGSYAFFQALSSILISKTLGLEALGYFSLALAMTAPVMLFSNFGLRILWVTDTENKYVISQFRKIRICTSLLGLLLCIGIAFIYSTKSDVITIISIIAFSKLVENLCDLHYATLHKQKKQKKIAISIFFRGFLGFIGLALGVYIFDSLVVGVLFYSISWLAVFLIYDYHIDIRLNTEIENKSDINIYKILKNGLPLAIAMLLINGNLAVPRLFLSEFVSIELLGVYSALSLFVLIGSIVVSSIGQVSLPILSEYYSDRQLKKHFLFVINMSFLILLMSLSGVAFFYFLGPLLLTLIFNLEVANYNSSLVLMFLLAPFQYLSTYMGSVISSTKKNGSLVISQFIMLIFNLVFSYFLIQKYELQGAIYAVCLSNLILLIFYFYYYYKAMQR